MVNLIAVITLLLTSGFIFKKNTNYFYAVSIMHSISYFALKFSFKLVTFLRVMQMWVFFSEQLHDIAFNRLYVKI